MSDAIESGDDGRSWGGVRLWVFLSLAITVGVGVFLRWFLAGKVLKAVPYENLWHLHIHLGYYGAVIPLIWLAAKRAGGRVPGSKSMLVYGLFVAVASVGFATRGYELPGIIGSTGVLAIWLEGAIRLQRDDVRRDSWLVGVPLGLFAVAAAIPMVAITEGAARLEWLRAFLSLLLLGVAVPTALLASRFQFRGGWLWWGATVVAGLATGPLESQILQLAFAMLGYIVLGTLHTSNRGRVPRGDPPGGAVGALDVGGHEPRPCGLPPHHPLHGDRGYSLPSAGTGALCPHPATSRPPGPVDLHAAAATLHPLNLPSGGVEGGQPASRDGVDGDRRGDPSHREAPANRGAAWSSVGEPVK